jgi:hypothetical protein
MLKLRMLIMTITLAGIFLFKHYFDFNQLAAGLVGEEAASEEESR